MAPSSDTKSPSPMLDVRDLSIGWGDTVLARNITFSVERGEVFAILGGSGSGKSTLLRFLIGLEPPIVGDIDIAGRGRPDLDAGLPPFGVMFQGGALFGSMTLVENVALALEEWTDLPLEATRVIARAKLRLVGLDGAEDQFPSEISGGMKKRAAIARALALEPDLVFLDEPSAGLDPITSAELDELIVTLSKSLSLTVVVVTHQLESIFRIADRALMLDKKAEGVIAIGPPRELRNSEDRRVRDFFNPSEAIARAGGPEGSAGRGAAAIARAAAAGKLEIRKTTHDNGRESTREAGRDGGRERASKGP